MSETTTPTTLECGHVELRCGRCATTDCYLYVGIDPSWDYRLPEEYQV